MAGSVQGAVRTVLSDSVLSDMLTGTVLAGVLGGVLTAAVLSDHSLLACRTVPCWAVC